MNFLWAEKGEPSIWGNKLLEWREKHSPPLSLPYKVFINDCSLFGTVFTIYFFTCFCYIRVATECKLYITLNIVVKFNVNYSYWSVSSSLNIYFTLITRYCKFLTLWKTQFSLLRPSRKIIALIVPNKLQKTVKFIFA